MSFRLDPDRSEHDRSVCRLLHLMGDVGGFVGILQILGSILLYLVPSASSASSFLITRLFERREAATKPATDEEKLESTTAKAQ